MSEKKKKTGEYLDAREFGELLGLNRESIYKAISRGELRAIRVGKAIRLPRAQLDELLTRDGVQEASRRIEAEIGEKHGL